MAFPHLPDPTYMLMLQKQREDELFNGNPSERLLPLTGLFSPGSFDRTQIQLGRWLVRIGSKLQRKPLIRISSSRGAGC